MRTSPGGRTGLDPFEQVFEDEQVSAPVVLDPTRSVVDQLRERVAALEGGPARVPVPTHPALTGAMSLHAGGTYGVDSGSLALALAAGASQAGEWVGFAGWAAMMIFLAELALGYVYAWKKGALEWE